MMALDQLYDLFLASLDEGVLQNICLLKGRSKRGHFFLIGLSIGQGQKSSSPLSQPPWGQGGGACDPVPVNEIHAVCRVAGLEKPCVLLIKGETGACLPPLPFGYVEY